MAGVATTHVPLNGSPTLRAAGVVGHLLAAAVVTLLASVTPWWGLLLPGVVAHAIVIDRRLARRDAASWVRLVWAADDRVQWTTRGNVAGRGECLDARVWGRSWVRLRVRDLDHPRRVHEVVLPRDATTPDAHRRLRVRCRVAPPHNTHDTAD
ncbi:protein YgfX [Salinisphaera sp. Q1T1-3]|uniref:protein YgfX n=1 Tax=Salinisphaera sp. Q1T1-3 TaxID=2321229 RepID=UPI0013142A36|nr:protein YgfX [Salinisphaera sp. Q1T1-3]